MKHGGRSPCPEEPDVHLTVQFASAQMDFVACPTAALVFVQDMAAHRACTIAVDSGDCVGLPRLPN